MRDVATRHRDVPARHLAESVLASECPFTLDLPTGVTTQEAKQALMELGSDNAWRAYDLVHQLAVFGRAF